MADRRFFSRDGSRESGISISHVVPIAWNVKCVDMVLRKNYAKERLGLESLSFDLVHCVVEAFWGERRARNAVEMERINALAYDVCLVAREESVLIARRARVICTLFSVYVSDKSVFESKGDREAVRTARRHIVACRRVCAVFVFCRRSIRSNLGCICWIIALSL